MEPTARREGDVTTPTGCPDSSPQADERGQPAPSATPPRPDWKRRARRVLTFLLVLYGAWLLALYLLQNRIIFPGTYLRSAAHAPPCPSVAEPLWLETADGARVEAWFIPGRGVRPDRPGPLLVFAHGNAELIDDWPGDLRPYTNWGISLLLPEYRGFGRSTGRPTEKTLVADFLAFYERVVARPEVDPQRVIFHGRSIGNGVLAQVARRHPPAAFILESAFTSLAAMTWRYLAPSFLLRSPLHTGSVLRDLEVPALILHGRRDEIIPVRHARRLHAMIPGSRYVEFDTRHNDPMSDEPEYWPTIHDFLTEHGLLAER